MGTAVARVPDEIWFYISTFLPSHTVKGLYAVNRGFSKAAVAARYRVLTFSKPYKHTKRLLQHISEFDRGAFVREVNIKSWPTSLEHSHGRGAGLWASIYRSLTPDCQWEQRVRDSERMEKDIQLVTDAICAMPQLYKCSLGWEDVSYHPRFYRALLTPIFAHIKDNLRSLALDVPPEVLHVMPSIDMPCLESLSVGLRTDRKSEEEINRTFDSFVVFVNNLLGSLESLSIASRAPSQSLKLDRFFRMLGTFPHLQSFSLSIPFDGSHLSSPDEVVNFLNKHRHRLKHLCLHTSRCSHVDTPVDAVSKYWIPNTLTRLKTIAYPQLYDLDFAIRPMKMELTPLLQFFELHTLESLTLTERALTYDEVKAIVDVTCKHPRGLKQLRLRVKYLSLDLLELLASRVPRLSLLELKFGEVQATRLFEDEIRENGTLFASWQLATLGLLQESLKGRVNGLLKVLVDCIPALQNCVDLKA